jgi:hypothetical protein
MGSLTLPYGGSDVFRRFVKAIRPQCFLSPLFVLAPLGAAAGGQGYCSFLPNPGGQALGAQDDWRAEGGTPVKVYMGREPVEPLAAAPQIVDVEHGILHYDKKTYCGHPRETVFGYFGNGEIVVGHHHAPCDYRVASDVEHGPKGYHGRAIVLLQRSTDYGKTWPKENDVVVYDETMPPDRKRALIFQPQAQREAMDMFSKDATFFFAKTYLPERRGRELCFGLRSADRGRTWESSGTIVWNPFDKSWGVLKSCLPVLRMPDGKTLLAAMEINMPDAPKYGGPWLYRSTDHGLNWEPVGLTRGKPRGKTEGRFTYAGLLRMPDGDLQCYYLHIGTGYVVDGVQNAICLSISKDDGRTWSDPVPIVGKGQECWKSKKPELPDKKGHYASPCYRAPWPMILRDGRILVLFNRRRSLMGIGGIVSADRGKTWSREFALRDDGVGGDLGYPVACQFEDGRIFVAYYYTMADGNGFGGTRYLAGSVFRIR